jgi:hypothetical protein
MTKMKDLSGMKIAKLVQLIFYESYLSGGNYGYNSWPNCWVGRDVFGDFECGGAEGAIVYGAGGGGVLGVGGWSVGAEVFSSRVVAVVAVGWGVGDTDGVAVVG